MEVGTIKAPDMNVGMSGQRAGMPADVQPASDASAVIQVKTEETKSKDLKDSKEHDEAAVPQTVEAVNQFLDLMNADLRFSLHQKTNRIMVQLVSEKDQKVLREYPSKEFLDMIARIRDFVGIFMDKKA